MNSSIIKERRLSNNKSCKLKNHFRGALRELIGYVDHLADRNPHRFIWISPSSLVQKFRRFQGGKYSDRQGWRALAVAKSLGMLVPVTVEIGRFIREGFTVKTHSDLCSELHGFCCLRLLDVTQDGSQHVSEDASKHVSKRRVRISVNTSVAEAENCPQAPENKSDIREDAPRTERAVFEPGEMRESRESGKPRTRKADSGNGSDPTQLPPSRSRSTIDIVTMDEITHSSLRSYAHRDELLASCQKAMAKMLDEGYSGHETHAKCMGLAMEILRQDYGYPVPKPWLPVMRKFRAYCPGKLEYEVLREQGLITEEERRAIIHNVVYKDNGPLPGSPDRVRWLRDIVQKEIDESNREEKFQLQWDAAWGAEMNRLAGGDDADSRERDIARFEAIIASGRMEYAMSRDPEFYERNRRNMETLTPMRENQY